MVGRCAIKYFIDTEFIDAGEDNPIELLSIALVAEDGRELYLQNGYADWGYASDWVRANVISVLAAELRDIPAVAQPKYAVRECVLDFIGDDVPEFWGMWSGYDYVVLSQLIGFEDWPKSWPMYINDAIQWQRMLGSPELPKQESAEHHALSDARHVRRVWEYLHELASVPRFLVGT